MTERTVPSPARSSASVERPVFMLRLIWLSFQAGSSINELKTKAEQVYTQTTNHMPHSLDRIDRNIALLVSLKGAKPVLPEDEE